MDLLDRDTSDWQCDVDSQDEHRFHQLNFLAPLDFAIAPLYEILGCYNREPFDEVPAGHGLCTTIRGDRDHDTFEIVIIIRESKKPYSANLILNGIDLGRSIYNDADFSILSADPNTVLAA